MAITLDSELTPRDSRRRLMNGLSADIQIAMADNQRIALLLVDIKGFRHINSKLGYNSGDQALIQVQKTLVSAIKKASLILRIGDNRFAIVIPEIKAPAVVQLAAEKIRRTLSQSIATDAGSISLDCHIGAAVFPDSHMSAEGLLIEAEESLFIAKNHDQSIVTIPSPDSKKPAINNIESKIITGLEQGEFRLFYQPKISLQGGVKLYGSEVLIRWKNKELGVISPDEFIPIAETTNLIQDITDWVIKAAAREKSELDHLFSPNAIAINLSAKDIFDKSILDTIDSAVAIWGINPKEITFEVTEGTIIKEPEKAFEVLADLRSRGMKVAIDDFGTGYSSLSYFKSIPADELKIDRSFIANMASDDEDKAIVNLIIELAKKFNMKVVAEGIENKETLELLIAMGCDYAQGHYMSKPMSGTDYVEWVKKSLKK